MIDVLGLIRAQGREPAAAKDERWFYTAERRPESLAGGPRAVVGYWERRQREFTTGLKAWGFIGASSELHSQDWTA